MSSSNEAADTCLPDELKDFVFDLHDSVRTSQIASEQLALYGGKFRELTAKYFEKSAWPSPEAVSAECGGDTLFLAFYRELTQRHMHSISRPSPKDRVDGWAVYTTLFDTILQHASDINNNTTDSPTPNQEAVYLLPEWIFDILHEFVYQFQGFCQFRTATFTNAAKYANGGPNEGKSTPNHLSESIDLLSSNRSAWAVEQVLTYLHKFVTIPNSNVQANNSAVFHYLSVFSAVTQSRLECLLGDYNASLNVLTTTILDSTSTIPPPSGNDDPTESDIPKPSSSMDLLNSVFSAKLSTAYHQGVCYLMLRRYRDASTVLGDICTTMHRGFKTGAYRNTPGSDQFGKLYDRMIALLAILTHVTPLKGFVDESIAKTIRDKHGKQLSKIEAGEEGYEDLFIYACPKFVSPSVPRYELAKDSQGGGQDAYKLQVKHFMNEMANQQSMRKLRSFMKLYTSISVEKLGRLVMEEDFLSLLVSYKNKSRQIERKKVGAGVAAVTTAGVEENEESEVETEAPGSIMDIHYFLNEDMIHVDEAEKLHRFENYFMKKISQCTDIMNDIDAISVNV